MSSKTKNFYLIKVKEKIAEREMLIEELKLVNNNSNDGYKSALLLRQYELNRKNVDYILKMEKYADTIYYLFIEKFLLKSLYEFLNVALKISDDFFLEKDLFIAEINKFSLEVMKNEL